MTDSGLFQDEFANLYDNVQVEIEFISAADAANLLSRNYAYNRDLIKANVRDLKKMMLDGKFVLSNDAIVIDEFGVLKNAQHRMEAIVQSGQGQWFVVMRNVSHDIGSIIDTGRSRTMSDRITFSGCKISRKECAIVRQAMCDIQSPTVGTVQYAKNYQDIIVKDTFLRFADYFEFLDSNKLSTHNYNSFIIGAGLKIWAHMHNDNTDYVHGMNREDRVRHWLEIACTGTPLTNDMKPQIDGAASRLFATKRDRREETNGAGGFWNDSPSLRKTVNAAHKFMQGENIGKSFYAVTIDPFKNLRKMQPTSAKYIMPENLTPQEMYEYIAGE
jgi:hypothetical protein